MPQEEIIYQSHPTRTSKRVMTIVVIVTIVLVALWAVTGGIERIPLPETVTG